MFLYRLIHPGWEDCWNYTLLHSNPNKYFEIEDKYIYALSKIIENSGYKRLNVRSLNNYEFMNYELINGELRPMNKELKEWSIQLSKEYYNKFSGKYTKSMRKLHSDITEEMTLNINQISDAIRLHLRGHIGFMLHYEYKYVTALATQYYYIMCENPIKDSLINHINEKGMIFEICNEIEYNDVYPLIEEAYNDGQIHF